MPEPEITLIPITPDRKADFYLMAVEFLENGDERHKPAIDDLDGYFERAEKFAAGVDLEPGKVRSNLFWLVRDGRILGVSSLRYELTPDLLLEGGNIGYNIRPTERLKGYGAMILKLTLLEAKKIGLTRARITCDSDNIGSVRIIEKNGGVYEGQRISKNTGKMVNRYWIEMTS